MVVAQQGGKTSIFDMAIVLQLLVCLQQASQADSGGAGGLFRLRRHAHAHVYWKDEGSSCLHCGDMAARTRSKRQFFVQFLSSPKKAFKKQDIQLQQRKPMKKYIDSHSSIKAGCVQACQSSRKCPECPRGAWRTGAGGISTCCDFQLFSASQAPGVRCAAA